MNRFLGALFIILCLAGCDNPDVSKPEDADKAITLVQNHPTSIKNVSVLKLMTASFALAQERGYTFNFDPQNNGWLAYFHAENGNYHLFKVEYHYTENLKAREADWLVDVNTGEVEPDNDIARAFMGK